MLSARAVSRGRATLLWYMANDFAGLKFDNTYSWCMRFDESGMVVEVRAYLDSWMVKQAIEENEVPSRRAPVPQLG